MLATLLVNVAHLSHRNVIEKIWDKLGEVGVCYVVSVFPRIVIVEVVVLWTTLSPK